MSRLFHIGSAKHLTLAGDTGAMVEAVDFTQRWDQG